MLKDQSIFLKVFISSILGDPGAGSQSGREKRRNENFQARAEEHLGTDSHRTISKRSSERGLLVGHKKCVVLLCPIGEQRMLSSFRELVHDCYSWVSEDAFHKKN